MHTDNKPIRRRIVSSSLGCHVLGHALPHPDPDDVDTMLAGVVKRFASCPPEADPILLGKLGNFVDRFLKKNLVPLSPLVDRSVETWLSKTSYTLARKKELLEIYRQFPECLPRFFKVKGFMKDETYPTWKHARGINSRHDRFKVEVGPVFKLIEDAVYKLKYFIKHTPVHLRAQKIKDALFAIGRKYFATDYTAFESLFVKKLMEMCEFKLYEYMVQYLPEGADWLALVKKVLGGKNHISYKFFDLEIEATRMSGEMCTSLGNGFSNLMFFLFVAEESGTLVDGFVEGDDGIFATLNDKPLKPELFTKLGLNIKLEVHLDLCSASFCGIIFDPEDCINVTDPREVLAGFGWTTNRYCKASAGRRMDLLRAKSLSYAYQYPGCPIISELAEYGLRMTRGRDIRHFVAQKWQTSQWEREQVLGLDYKNIPRRAVGMNTRLLVERKYGISIEIQLKIEKYLRELEVLQPLDVPCFDLMTPQSWRDYAFNYQSLGKDQTPPDMAPDHKILFPSALFK